jgi:hypothetical protein
MVVCEEARMLYDAAVVCRRMHNITLDPHRREPRKKEKSESCAGKEGGPLHHAYDTAKQASKRRPRSLRVLVYQPGRFLLRAPATR